MPKNEANRGVRNFRKSDDGLSRAYPERKIDDGLPRAYVEGRTEFYGFEFLVDNRVLIPRPETEQLIDMVLSMAGMPILPGVKAPEPVIRRDATIMDVGTGSGCIAVTLKKKLPEARVVASDISSEALDVARENARCLDVSITFIISYLLEKVKSGEVATPDVVVANLPYVDENWQWLDKKRLGYEPRLALYAENGGLALIEELIHEAYELGVEWLVIEADPCQHERISTCIEGRYSIFDVRGYIIGLRLLH